MTLMSLRQYAKHRGCSHQAVAKAIKAKRISTVPDEKGNPKINPEVADREWKNNSAPEKKTTPTRAELGRVEAPGADSERAPETGELAAPAYARSKAIKEAYAAKLAGLEYQERLGKLISADKVRMQAFNCARIVRDSILNVPDRVSAEIAAETDPHRVHLRLTQELIKALEELTRAKS